MGVCASSKKNNVYSLRECASSHSSMNLLKNTKELEKSICKIDEIGTGFLCLIPIPNQDHSLKVLMTCYHLLNDLKKRNKIKLTFESGKEILLSFDESRIIYKNEENDILFIDLKDKEFYLDNFLIIDKDIYEGKEFDKIYKNASIYIIHYPKGRIVYSFDSKPKFDEMNNIFHHCPTEKGSSGAPIMNLNNHRVIGIHIGNSLNYQIGKVINFPITYYNKKIEEFKNYEYNKTEKRLNSFRETNYQKEEKIINEIKLILKIRKEDINKEIYFLDNTDYRDSKTKKKHYHDNLKELNEKNTKLFVNDKECKYSKFIIPSIEGEYEIKLLIFIKMENFSHMFYNCKNIISINISNFNTSNVIDMSYMFSGCSNLSNISDISFFNTINVTDMSYMFDHCSNISALPDISFFNTINVTNMSHMFFDCSKLSTLPDISNWNTIKVTNMSGMFWGCSKLSTLPDISNWNTKNVSNMNNMFGCCYNLSTLPDISKWNTNKVTNRSFMFWGCSKKLVIPDKFI